MNFLLATSTRNISDVHSDFQQAVIRYRENLIFSNSLIMEQFEARYSHRTAQRIMQLTDALVTEEKIDKYSARRASEYEAKRVKYQRTLEGNVESSVQKYANNLRAAFTALDSLVQ